MLADSDAGHEDGIRRQPLGPGRHGQNWVGESAGQFHGQAGPGLQLRWGHWLAVHRAHIYWYYQEWVLGLLWRVQQIARRTVVGNFTADSNHSSCNQGKEKHSRNLGQRVRVGLQFRYIRHIESSGQRLWRAIQTARQLENAVQTCGDEYSWQHSDQRDIIVRRRIQICQRTVSQDCFFIQSE